MQRLAWCQPDDDLAGRPEEDHSLDHAWYAVRACLFVWLQLHALGADGELDGTCGIEGATFGRELEVADLEAGDQGAMFIADGHRDHNFTSLNLQGRGGLV